MALKAAALMVQPEEPKTFAYPRRLRKRTRKYPVRGQTIESRNAGILKKLVANNSRYGTPFPNGAYS